MTDPSTEPLFVDPEPEDDLSVPTGSNLARWLEADGGRRVSILAPDAAQARTWAEARGIPLRRTTVIKGAGQLYGMFGPEHVIVRVQGPGGTNTRADRALATAINVCLSADVHLVDDVIPMEAEAHVSQTIGGAEITSHPPGSPVRVLPRLRTQGDTFSIQIDGDRFDVPRESIDELVEVIAAWKESRPYVDAAAARAAEIRAAVLAGKNPLAPPPTAR